LGVRGDGAPNMFDMQAFYEAMLDSVQATVDDPVRLGFRTDIPLAQAKYVVDTAKPGNANTGHTFRVALSAADKHDPLEYLKTY
jgi:hypothetical protein